MDTLAAMSFVASMNGLIRGRKDPHHDLSTNGGRSGDRIAGRTVCVTIHRD